MKNKKTILSLFALFVVGLLMSVTAVSAYRGDYTTQGPYYDEERHEEMETAFENLDYAKWHELMTENGRGSRVLEKVTEENFAKFVEAHNAGLSGDYETANQLRSELGLNNGVGPKDGTGYKQGNSKVQRNLGNRDCLGTGQNLGQGKGRA
jgi:hypothetical protein